MKRKITLHSTMDTIQWFIFLLASTVAMPIVIGAIFELNFTEIAGLMQRSFLVVGMASLLQIIFGHRLPIVEGPAGIWISIFAAMAAIGTQAGASSYETLQLLEMTMILAGIFLFLIGAFKISEKILPIFTPLVTGTFFLLLTVQLSGTFLMGMLGIQGEAATIQVKEAMLAFLTFFIVLALSTFAKGWFKSYAVFIGIVIGWLAFSIVVGETSYTKSDHVFSIPEVFAFGLPSFDISIVPIAFICALILISNLVASIVAMEGVLDHSSKMNPKKVNQGTMLSGLNHGLAGVFSTVANVPLATTAGFIALTGQKSRKPYIIAVLILIFVAFFPPIVSFLASIPSPIANAALMATFVQLVGLAIKNLTLEPLDSRKVTILGIAYLVGMGTMFLPPEVFFNLPIIIQSVMSNGLLVGTGLVIVIEQLWKKK